ncbi:hypothetical protein [Sulfurisphaera ohwakuensis]|uniref:hypothetical protein n=1 Tax=Sulfurisphaera ohwakuensis TaxID=69656 RepID=UPI0036F3D763
MRIHINWELPFDTKTATELGITIYELLPYCSSIEGDSEGVVLECLDLSRDELTELKKKLKYVMLEVEE